MSIYSVLKERILILDGAMGTMLQRGLSEEQTLKAYIDAGADIITTNSFGANSIAMASTGSGQDAAAEAYQAALRARSVADNAPRKVWVAGSAGPTGKSLTLPSDADDPSWREYGFDDFVVGYKEQLGALIRGGVDLILLETCFDALNAKAAIKALDELGADIPVIVSATVSDMSGRTLCGQTLEAFYRSIEHAPHLLAFGINCALGAEAMAPLARDIAAFSSHPLIFYPNAGIPDETGSYNDSPALMAQVARTLASEGVLNITGGCCGTSPEHIAAIASAVKGCAPRIPQEDNRLTVSGLEAFTIERSRNFTNVGERTNVAGSRKFARLVAGGSWDEAMTIAAAQIEGGADVIDINMDDPMMDSALVMREFTRRISSEPAVARAAVMIDSSHWETVLEGLKNCPGKCIVNSISLKEGEAEFIRKALSIKSLGGAMVVMAFDEQGQAVTLDRKIEICSRSYRLLTGAGIRPCDIIFDANILSIGTGIPEHARFGVDFIEAVRWTKGNLPGALTSGGVSNLSFAFRGNNLVREAMHSAFLYHAIKAGLDMAIVNPQMLRIYDDLDPDLRQAVEDVIFDTDPDATSRLVDLAAILCSSTGSAAVVGQGTAAQGVNGSSAASGQVTSSTCAAASGHCVNGSGTTDEAFGPAAEVKAAADPARKLSDDVVKGLSASVREDALAALEVLGTAVAVVEGPLMDGMRRVGELFADGRMFLPQVVKSARTMRDAVTALEPFMDRSGDSSSATAAPQSSAAGGQPERKPRFVIATVQGDVHDIGKNITSIVLQCSGFEVIDLGVMVPCSTILAKAEEVSADIIGVSGLITPSLQRMEEICREMAARAMSTPLFVGGAAASAVHTAVKLAPLYPNVHYGSDASATAVMAKRYIYDRESFISYESDLHSKLAALREQGLHTPDVITTPTAETGFLRQNCFDDMPLTELGWTELEQHFDWRMFYALCGLKPKIHAIGCNCPDCQGLEYPYSQYRAEALAIIRSSGLRVLAAARFYDCHRLGDTLVARDLHRPAGDTFTPGDLRPEDKQREASCTGHDPHHTPVTTFASGELRLPMLRDGASLCDYFPTAGTSPLGIFAATVTAGKPSSGAHNSSTAPAAASLSVSSSCAADTATATDLYTSNATAATGCGSKQGSIPDIVGHAVRATLAEAASQYLQSIWRQALPDGIKLIAPGIGYPCCPDHSLKRDILVRLPQGLGITLTESCAMIPEASVCGLVIAHRDARYLNVRTVDAASLDAYASERGFTPADRSLFLSHLAGK